MKRNVLNVLLAIIIATGLAGCKKQESPPPEVVDATQHDNWVFLVPYWGNATLVYVEANHSITSGQPWGGVSSGTPDQQWGIDAKAGRHGSSSVADWFRSNASVATCTMDCTSTWPSELNFAFTGTLTINGTAYQITLGQGSTGSSNNWWVGGPGWTIHPGIYANVVTPDGKYFFEPEEDDSNGFWIKTSY